jgi:hypothetical protein
MTITAANISKVISAATGCFWALVGLVLWSDLRSGDWLQKGGLWIVFVIFAGTCGMGFWVMIAPLAIRALRENLRPQSLAAWGKAFWCFSSIPLVLLCFGFFCLLVYYRLTE